MASVFEIRGVVKNYEWGKKGHDSMVAVLQKSSDKDFNVVDDKPYAELWLGTHESGPSVIPMFNNIKLSEWLIQNKKNLGNISGESTIGLPFLFKVLSVNKALSIQAHPDKETALKLHKEFPQHYPDDNHKPELAIALTSFEALCGFRPIQDITKFLMEIPELQVIIGTDLCEQFLSTNSTNNLSLIFKALMTSSTNVFQVQLSQIKDNFSNNKYNSVLSSSIKNIFFRTYEQYPGDIGCLCLFFLNYIKLESGEAVFLAANEPHAYLSGDCVECMACSDNVVRAGLTPKYRDVETLCSILTYNCKYAEENIFPAVIDPTDIFVKTYSPPVKEFSIDSILLPANQENYCLKALPSASILLVIKGVAICTCEDGKIDLGCGTCLFISSDCGLKISSSTEILMFRAYCKII